MKTGDVKLKAKDIKQIEIGLTTKCNSKCPLCIRTKFPPEIVDIDMKY